MRDRQTLQQTAPNPAARPLTEAMAHHHAGRFAEAERLYRRAITLAPRHASALCSLGGLYVQNGKPEQALSLLQNAAQTQPSNPEILNCLGMILRDTGRSEEAAAHFRRALAINPSYVDALNNLGGVLQSEKNFGEAILLYEEALRRQPEYLPALANLAAALRETNRPEESIARYKQALRLAPADARLWVGLGLSHRQLQQLAEAIACFQEGLRFRRGHPETLFFLGSALLEQHKFDSALESYAQALLIRPHYPEAHFNMGVSFWHMGKLEQAVLSYEKALGQQPDYVAALQNLSKALVDLGRVAEAHAKLESALQIEPNNPGLMNDFALLLYRVGKINEALEYLNRVLTHTPQDQNILYGKGLALIALGQYREGWQHHEAGFGDPATRGHSPFAAVKPWDGKPAPDKHLLIWREQGLGDSLQFVRYAELCKQRVGKVSVVCPKPLVRLFKALPFIEDAFDAPREASSKFDEHISMMSLPHRFETVLETVPATVPYLRVDPEIQAKWAVRFTDVSGIKIGLVWAGGLREGNIEAKRTDRQRSISLERMKPWLDLQGARFYNLQKDKPREQIAALGLTDRLTDFMGEVADFADTAAIVQHLDLVITVDTAVAHLAGGLGKPVWILSRYNACWRWLQNRPTNPWYPTARIFGQPSMGDWDSVMAEVGRELAAEIEKHGGNSVT